MSARIEAARRRLLMVADKFGRIKTAKDIQAALDAGTDLSGLVGRHISCLKDYSALEWDVVDYDETGKVITLLLHDTLPTQRALELAQALAWFENGLAAGNYYFTNSGTNYYFTLANTIPAGGQLRATTTSFSVYASQSATTASETGTVSTTEIAGAASIGTTASDAGAYPLNDMGRVNYGGNNFAEAGQLQWLNSGAPANTQMPRINKFSRPYAASEAGFLSGLDKEFLACVGVTGWKCRTNAVYEAPASIGLGVPRSTAYTILHRVGFASRREIFGIDSGIDAGDVVFDLYAGALSDDRIKYYNNSARVWRTRSPYGDTTFFGEVVNTNGASSTFVSSNSYGVVPCCKIYRTQDTIHRVGGKIFYIDETATGATYEFYDYLGNVLTDVRVGDEPWAYKVTGTPTKPKYYVVTPNAVTNKTWTYQKDGAWVYEPLGTQNNIGDGKTNTALVVAADGGAYQAAANTIWNALKSVNDRVEGGCFDWFVPSKAELEALRTATDRDGNALGAWFGNTYIWTSVEYNANDVWYWSYNGQSWNAYRKNDNNSLLPTRSF